MNDYLHLVYDVYWRNPAELEGLLKQAQADDALGVSEKQVVIGEIKRRLPVARRLGKVSPSAKLRAFIRDRDKSTCRYCGDRYEGRYRLEKYEMRRFMHWPGIDHVIPVAQGGTATIENLVFCCASCNSKKRERTLEQAGMTLREVPS